MADDKGWDNDESKLVPADGIEGVDLEVDPRILQIQASICKIMSNPRRVKILRLLEHGEKSVGELVELTGLRKAAVSQNLGLMRDRHLVEARRDGQKVYYNLRVKKLLVACHAVEEVLQDLLKLEENGK
ncbi:MAG: winged helix-turn-helix transcriptional regulator [bacterium]|nr:winged helix-turn-helix transcriptional regulator [bacterium]